MPNQEDLRKRFLAEKARWASQAVSDAQLSRFLAEKERWASQTISDANAKSETTKEDPSQVKPIEGRYDRAFPMQATPPKDVQPIAGIDHEPRFKQQPISQEAQNGAKPEGYFPISDRDVPKEVRESATIDGYYTPFQPEMSEDVKRTPRIEGIIDTSTPQAPPPKTEESPSWLVSGNDQYRTEIKPAAAPAQPAQDQSWLVSGNDQFKMAKPASQPAPTPAPQPVASTPDWLVSGSAQFKTEQKPAPQPAARPTLAQAPAPATAAPKPITPMVFGRFGGR